MKTFIVTGINGFSAHYTLEYMNDLFSEKCLQIIEDLEYKEIVYINGISVEFAYYDEI